jgi:hypothetical protein
MRSSVTAGLIVSSAIAVAACGGGGGIRINQDAQPVAGRWNAILATPAQLAGVTQVRGTGWMSTREKDTTQTEAHVAIENAAPGGRHPWHVHMGQCGADRGILGPANAYPVLKVNGDGKADADAVLPLVMPRTGQYFVNVHASATNMGTIVACGNLAPPSH